MSRIIAFILIASATAFAAEPPPPLVRSVSFSPDGSLVSAAVMPKDRGGRVFVWDVASHKLLSKYDQAGESPMAQFSADSKSIVLANGRKLLPVIDPKTGQKVDELGPLPTEATNLFRAGTDKWLLRNKDGGFRLWDAKEKKVVHEFAAGKNIWGWGVSPNGKWLFVNESGVDKAWDVATGKEIADVFKSKAGRSNVVTFVTEDWILMGSNSGSHRVVELPSGKEILRFKNEGGTGAVIYSQIANILACRYHTDSSIALTPLTFRKPTDAEKARVSELLKACDSDDYSTREKAAASLVEMGSAIVPLLKAATIDGPSAEVRMRARIARESILNKPKARLVGHLDEVRATEFSPNGKLIATGAADGLVILWDVATGKEVVRLSTAVD